MKKVDLKNTILINDGFKKDVLALAQWHTITSRKNHNGYLETLIIGGSELPV